MFLSPDYFDIHCNFFDSEIDLVFDRRFLRIPQAHIEGFCFLFDDWEIYV